VVFGGLAGLAAGGAVAVVHGEEVAAVAEVLEHAAGVLALLFFWAGAHQGRDVHFYVF
jgi:hypothetical protein